MTGSELPQMAAARARLRAAIDHLQSATSADTRALLRDNERAQVDAAIVGALELLTDDAATHSLLERFTPGPVRRPARATDVLVTLRLLDQALDGISP